MLGLDYGSALDTEIQAVVGVPGEDRVHCVVHLPCLGNDLVGRSAEVGVQGTGVGEHHDGPDVLVFELRGPAVHRRERVLYDRVF